MLEHGLILIRILVSLYNSRIIIVNTYKIRYPLAFIGLITYREIRVLILLILCACEMTNITIFNASIFRRETTFVTVSFTLFKLTLLVKWNKASASTGIFFHSVKNFYSFASHAFLSTAIMGARQKLNSQITIASL